MTDASIGWKLPRSALAIHVLARLVVAALVASPALAGGPGPIVRAPSETATNGTSPEESRLHQRELHAWLASQMPPGALDTPIRVQLPPDERRDLDKKDNPDLGRIRVGVVKPVGKPIVFGRADLAALSKTPRRAAGGVLRATDDGGFVWTASIQSDGAAGLRVHLTDLNLPPDAALYFFGLNGEAFGPYRGGGPDGSRELWSNTVMDELALVLLRHAGPSGARDLRKTSVVLADVGYVGPRFLAELNPVPESFCESNASCVENATCYTQTPADAAKYAVALMQWVSGPYLYSCSGGLLADTAPGSQIPYFLSANHCISRKSDAQSLECFFRYQAGCGVTMCPSKTGFPRTLGATLKATNRTGDYTLLQLGQSPPAGSAFLGWNNQPVAFTNGAELYRISHPLASPQAFSEHRVSTSAATCRGWPRGSWIYSRDVVGTTEGGSSGSPVVNGAGEVVGQLSGGCGFTSDPCDSVSNATVDGAFAAYYDQVAAFLAPGAAGELCNDGADNDGDGAIDCSDTDCAADPACAVCGPVGASCTTNAECCSQKCRGRAGGMVCR